MKSKRSVIRAILFMLRLQKSVRVTRGGRGESRREVTGPTHRLIRAESTKHRRRSSSKNPQRHRNSAPSSTFPLRSPSLFRSIASCPYNDKLVDFGVFSGMSQPYSVGLDDSHGRPLISVCAGAAHTLASTALLCRQQSLDEPANRALEKVANGTLLRGISMQRQASIGEQKRSGLFLKTDENDNRLQKKAVKSNMISMFGALLAIEQEDESALRLVLSKHPLEVNAYLSSGQYAEHKTKWTLLDIALNLNNVPCVKLLQEHGARENPYMDTIAKRRFVLEEAIEETSESIIQLKAGPMNKESEKMLRALAAHLCILERMRNALSIRDIPGSPEDAKAEAHSSTSVAIYFLPHAYSDIIVKYKVEWSVYPNFATIFGDYIETNMTLNPIVIRGLEPGLKLSFRISAGGLHGFSEPSVCYPLNIELSSWAEVDGRRLGWDEHIDSIGNLTERIERHRQSLVWQRVFPASESLLKKKKNGIKELFTASSKFTKNVTRGVYLASLIYTEGKVLCSIDDCLPILPIDENVTTLSKDDHHWLMKMSLCWEQIGSLIDSNPNAYANNISLSFRTKLINAAISMHHALGIKDIGHLYYLPVTYENSIFLVTVRFLDQNQQVQGLTLRWLTFDKLLRKKMASPAVESLTKETVNILNFFESSQIPLKRGLYLCYMKLHSSLNTIRVVVPDNLPSMLPFVHVRDNPHITKEEWSWVKSTDINEPFEPTPTQCELHRQLSTATQTLLHDLDIDSDLVPGHRLHHAEIIEPSPDVSIILLLPRAEEVCSAPTGSMVNTDFSEQRRGCSSIPIPVFEMIHQCTYQPEFISTYCRLSIFLEHYMMISQYEQRKCLLENDIKVFKTQYDILAEFQKELDEIWKSARWISRIATEARDKHVKVSRNAVPLGRLLAPLKPQYLDDSNDVGYHSDQETNGTLRVRKPLMSIDRPRSLLGSPQESYRDIDALYRRRKISMEIRRRASDIYKLENGSVDHSSSQPHRHHVQVANHLTDRPALPAREECRMPSGTVTVHSAYDCSLPRGTPVRLSISGNTTSSEVLSLVLEQFAKSSATPDTDILLPDANDYCIVAIVGERERRLKDNFPILRLQPPWSKGKLFVRRRNDLLAAVQIGNEAVV